MSRLTIDVTDQQHQSLKALAALQGKTIKEYAIEKLFSSNPDEERALIELTALLKQRMEEAENGDVDTRSFTEIAEAILTQSKSARRSKPCGVSSLRNSA